MPDFTYFKPAGIRMTELEEVVLTVDEFEAVRLKDLEGLEQEEVAKKMDISQPTLHRLILSARRKIAEAIVKGKAIKIEGGAYMVAGRGMGRGPGRGLGMGRRTGAGIGGGGRGLGGGPYAAGPGGTCVCPKCKHEISHSVGTPCYQIRCPKCGTQMVRGR